MKKNMRKSLIYTALVLLLCTSLSVPSFASDICNEEHLWILGAGHCNANGVNIRTGPGKKYSSLGLAYKDDKFNHYQTKRDSEGNYEWIHVHGRLNGWIYMDYYTDVEAARSLPDVPATAYTEAGGSAENLLYYEVA